MVDVEKYTKEEQGVWDALQAVTDPEIPVISVVDMGIVTGVSVEGENAHITMTPTFVGCPAISVMQQDIKKAAENLGYKTEVIVDMEKGWSSNLISERGKQQLKEFGLAPPRKVGVNGVTEEDLKDVQCPNCNSTNTSLNSPFGPTLCRAIHFCYDCEEGFQQFKPI